MNPQKRSRAVLYAVAMLATSPLLTLAQAPGGASAPSDGAAFKPEELEQLVAPIALHPDSLVAQILMASTYPIEIIYAERWLKANKNLQGDALAAALEKEDWDDSVKSLINFPDVVAMMSEKLDWTQKLGDAFLAQQKPVMDAIQRLRKKAKEKGNLESNEQQKVIVQPADTTTTTTTTVTETYIIESTSPDVVYVPTYNPTVVYGAWPYPAYPPYSYYPPGYVAGAAISFGLGVACGAAWGAWGSCNWGHGDIDIDHRSFNSTRIDNSRSASNVGNRNTTRQSGSGKWQHDASHRKGASYRDQNTAKKFGGESTRQAAQARDSFRGRSDAGRQDLARGGAGQSPGGAGRGGAPGSSNRPQATNRPAASDRSASANRGSSSQPNRGSPSQGNRTGSASGGGSSGNRGGAFEGAGQGGQAARQESNRGQASRSSSSGSGSRSSASRGGGGSRSGGGGRGGGAPRGGGGGGGRRGPGYEVLIY